MTTAEIAHLEDARRSAMAYAPESVNAEAGSGYLLTAISWTVGFVVIAAAVFFAFA